MNKSVQLHDQNSMGYINGLFDRYFLLPPLDPNTLEEEQEKKYPNKNQEQEENSKMIVFGQNLEENPTPIPQFVYKKRKKRKIQEEKHLTDEIRKLNFGEVDDAELFSTK